MPSVHSGDGGYLDNKPFTYAIQTVKKRHAILPVDRRLIYIEPAPETLSNAAVPRKGEDTRPSAVENSLDALVVLPRYETIRQDIENVIHWNADIARLHRVLTYVDAQIGQAGPDGGGPQGIDTYMRLRLSGATDQLGDRLAEAIKVEPSSAAGEAVRAIADAWRSRKFGPIVMDLSDNLGPLQRFLDLFDFDYCERAIRFPSRPPAADRRKTREEEESRAISGDRRRLHRAGREAAHPESERLAGRWRGARKLGAVSRIYYRPQFRRATPSKAVTEAAAARCDAERRG